MSINNICLVGRLGATPEIVWTENGCRTKTSLAVRIDKDTADWYAITAFGKQAEVLGNYAKKGDQIAIEGKLQLNTWTDNMTGEPRSRAEVIASKITLLAKTREEVTAN